MLTPYAFPGQTLEEDVTRTPRQWIEAAIGQYEGGNSRERLRGAQATSVWRLRKGPRLSQRIRPAPTAELAGPLSWAYLMQGNALSAKAKAMMGDEAERLFLEAE